MHVHTSEGSECAGSVIEDYMEAVERLRCEGRDLDGLVVTEHGVLTYDPEPYQRLSSKYGILILRGVEINTDYCHMLLYGMEQEHWEGLGWAGERTLRAREVIDTALRTEGMVAVPAHPFRACPVGGHRDFSGVGVIEVFNGANNETQDLRAEELARELKCKVIAGSDAHRAQELGKCVTEFDAPIGSIQDLVRALEKGKFRAHKLSQDGLRTLPKPLPY